MGNLRLVVTFIILLFFTLPISFAETPTIVWEKDIPTMTMFSISPNGEYIAVIKSISSGKVKEGTYYLSFYNKKGELLWDRDINAQVTDMDISNDGKVVYGTEYASTNYKSPLFVLNRSGEIVFEIETKVISLVSISHDGSSITIYGAINETTPEIFTFDLKSKESWKSSENIETTETCNGPLTIAQSSNNDIGICGLSGTTPLRIFSLRDRISIPIKYNESDISGKQICNSWSCYITDATEIQLASISNDGKFAGIVERYDESKAKIFFINLSTLDSIYEIIRNYPDTTDFSTSIEAIAEWNDDIEEGVYDILISSDGKKLIVGGRNNIYEYTSSGDLTNKFEIDEIFAVPKFGKAWISVSEAGKYLVRSSDGKVYLLSGPESVTETTPILTELPLETETPKTTSHPTTTSSPQTNEPPIMKSKETSTSDAELEKAKLEQEQSKGACGPSAIILLAMLPLFGTGLLRRND